MPRTLRTQTYDEYRYGPRGCLRPGDPFRVRGGPVYRTDDGRTIPMAERGLFIFRCYAVRGRARWIEATRTGSGEVVTLWVGPSMPSPTISGLRRRPYRVIAQMRPTGRIWRRRKSGH